MRVRKSVPEGYKTGSEYSAFTLFNESAQSKPGYGNGKEASRSKSTVPMRAYGRNELAPFCGLMKVGGLAQQSVHDVLGEVPGEDDVPFLSQGSTVSDISLPESALEISHKRRFSEEWEEEEEEEEEAQQQKPRDWDMQLSPKSRPMNYGGNRVLAQPRSRRGVHAKHAEPVSISRSGQENFGVAGDFEEAHFLDYGVLDEDIMRD
jgi:hypothetical protein